MHQTSDFNAAGWPSRSTIPDPRASGTYNSHSMGRIDRKSIQRRVITPVSGSVVYRIACRLHGRSIQGPVHQPRAAKRISAFLQVLPPTATATTLPASTLAAALVSEVTMTFMFLIVILWSTHSRAPVGFAGLTIGLALTLIHLINIPVTNTSVNPARSTGPAIFVGGWALEQLWLFLGRSGGRCRPRRLPLPLLPRTRSSGTGDRRATARELDSAALRH